VREFDDREALEVALVENVQRQDLTPLEEAEGYRRLIDEFGHTQEEIAERVGKSRSHIANMLRLLGLPDEVKLLLESGALSAGHARTLIGAENPLALAKEIVEKGLNVRDAETLAGALHRLANRWDEVQEAIGRAITGGGHTGSGFDAFLERLTRLAEFIDSHRASFDRIERLFNAMSAVQGRGIEQLSPFARIMSRITGDDGSTPEVDFGKAMMEGGQRLMAEREIAANAARAKAERDAEQQKKEVEELKKRIADTEGGVESPELQQVLRTYRKLGYDLSSEPGAVTNQMYQLNQLSNLGAGLRDMLARANPQAADLTTTPYNSTHPAQTIAEATKTVSGFGRGFRDSFGDGAQYLEDFDERLGKMAGESIPALAEGFEKMFEALGRGGNVFATLGKGLSQMIAEVAAKMSAEEFAQGLAMLARSIWDFFGPNPVAGASATQHFAAAAAFGALAGAASLGGGSSRSYGGGGALGGPSFQQQQSTLQGAGNAPITVYLPRSGYVLDPNNKDSVDGFLGFIQQLQSTRQVNLVVQ